MDTNKLHNMQVCCIWRNLSSMSKAWKEPVTRERWKPEERLSYSGYMMTVRNFARSSKMRSGPCTTSPENVKASPGSSK